MSGFTPARPTVTGVTSVIVPHLFGAVAMALAYALGMKLDSADVRRLVISGDSIYVTLGEKLYGFEIFATTGRWAVFYNDTSSDVTDPRAVSLLYVIQCLPNGTYAR